MFCYNCGKSLVEGARFCSYCGTAVPDSIHTGEASTNSGITSYALNAREEPFQLRRYESIFIEYKNDFWWRELVNEVGVQKIYVNCIYKERDDWNRIKVEIDDLAYCEGNLVPVGDKLYLFLYEEDIDDAKSYLCTCERIGNEIIIKKEPCKNVSKFSDSDFAPIIYGDNLYCYSKNGRQWLAFHEPDKSVVIRELIRPKCMNESEKATYQEEIEKLPIHSPFLYKNDMGNMIYAGMQGSAMYLFRFELNHIDMITHINKPGNRFVLTDPDTHLINNMAINTRRNYVETLNLDSMEYQKRMLTGYEIKNSFVIDHSFFLQIYNEKNRSTGTYLFNIEKGNFIKVEHLLSCIDDDNDLIEVHITRVGVNENYVAFSYTTEEDGDTHYSVVPKNRLWEPETNIIDYEIKR